jgi:protein SCO1
VARGPSIWQGPRVPAKHLAIALSAAIVAAGAVAVVVIARGDGDARARRRPPADYGTVPEFSLRDQAGEPVTEAWLRGHVTIVDFVFTRCDTICPVLSFKMARLDDQTRDLDRVRLLSFSVDPAYDTPEVLAGYAARYGAEVARWKFVTGAYPEVVALVEGALMTAMQDVGTTASGAPDIRHGGHFLLVDGDLRIRGVYDSNEPGRLDVLAADARRLAR